MVKYWIKNGETYKMYKICTLSFLFLFSSFFTSPAFAETKASENNSSSLTTSSAPLPRPNSPHTQLIEADVAPCKFCHEVFWPEHKRAMKAVEEYFKLLDTIAERDRQREREVKLNGNHFKF